MKKTLSHKDILDLEYFFHFDSGKKHDDLHTRDRKIYLALETKNESINVLLLYWLQQLRYNVFEAKGALSPGTTFNETLRLTNSILPLCSLITGLLSGFAFFTYTGETPVNVFHFLTLFIFSQLILLLLLPIAFCLKLLPGINQTFSVTTNFYSSLVSWFASRIQSGISKTVSGERRYNYNQVTGLIRKARRRYGQAMFWPFFILSQKIVVAFNAGLLTATLFQIATSDLAFGWQSTINFTSDALYSFVKVIALPWSWFVPEHLAYPSINAIEGSRIILKDSIYNLATQDLISWWPFLVFCLVFYGLLLRLGLLLMGKYLQKRCLSNLIIDTPDASRVIQRMKTPVVSTQAIQEHAQEESDASAIDHTQNSVDDNDTKPAIPVTLLIPDDIGNDCPLNQLDSLLEYHGFRATQREDVMQGHEADQIFFQKMVGTHTNTAVMLVMELWMPPIGDLFRFLRNLRSTLPTATPIHIGLLQKPLKTNEMNPSTDHNFKIWKQKIDNLGDPYLSILILHNIDHVPGKQL